MLVPSEISQMKCCYHCVDSLTNRLCSNIVGLIVWETRTVHFFRQKILFFGVEDSMSDMALFNCVGLPDLSYRPENSPGSSRTPQSVSQGNHLTFMLLSWTKYRYRLVTQFFSVSSELGFETYKNCTNIARHSSAVQLSSLQLPALLPALQFSTLRLSTYFQHSNFNHV